MPRTMSRIVATLSLVLALSFALPSAALPVETARAMRAHAKVTHEHKSAAAAAATPAPKPVAASKTASVSNSSSSVDEYLISGFQVFNQAGCSVSSSVFFSAGSGSGQCQRASSYSQVSSVKASCSYDGSRTTLSISTYSDGHCATSSSYSSTTFAIDEASAITCDGSTSFPRTAKCVKMKTPDATTSKYNLDNAKLAAGSLRTFTGSSCDGVPTRAIGFQWVGQCVAMGSSSIKLTRCDASDSATSPTSAAWSTFATSNCTGAASESSLGLSSGSVGVASCSNLDGKSAVYVTCPPAGAAPPAAAAAGSATGTASQKISLTPSSASPAHAFSTTLLSLLAAAVVTVLLRLY